jgi:hypothetical protein
MFKKLILAAFVGASLGGYPAAKEVAFEHDATSETASKTASPGEMIIAAEDDLYEIHGESQDDKHRND